MTDTREKVIEALQGVPASDHFIGELADDVLVALGLQEGGPNCIVPREPTEAMLDRDAERGRIVAWLRGTNFGVPENGHAETLANAIAANQHRKETT